MVQLLENKQTSECLVGFLFSILIKKDEHDAWRKVIKWAVIAQHGCDKYREWTSYCLTEKTQAGW